MIISLYSCLVHTVQFNGMKTLNIYIHLDVHWYIPGQSRAQDKGRVFLYSDISAVETV